MPDAILSLNAGSSSLKFGLFEIGAGTSLALLAKGEVERLQDQPHLIAKDHAGATLVDRPVANGATSLDQVLADLLGWIDDHLGDDRLVAAGHRIVHGGRAYAEPVVLDDAVLADLDALTPLAPLHQPACLAPVRALQKARPTLQQVCCFDTAFHHGLAPPVSRYAIPRRFEAKGIRRYGFHGLSYEFIAAALRDVAPELVGKRVVVAHLGNGASLCAMRDGKSVDTTMGFSALDGLVMGTRCGAIDPGILLYLQRAEGLTADAVEHLLYHDSGLLGVSQIAADMRTLLASDDPHAAEAVDLFTFSVARQTAALANTLQGLDGLVFTGGIGEHAKEIRAQVCERLGWLGVELDAGANDAGVACISAATSRVAVRVIATNEECIIARHTRTLYDGQG